MSQKFSTLILAVFFAAVISGCSKSSTSSTGSTTSTRTIDANTSNYKAVTVSVMGTTETCEQLTRDTSSCQSSRTSLGLSGEWLDFSCNVVLDVVDGSYNSVSSLSAATYIKLTTYALPDYKSNYYPTTGTYTYTAYSYSVTGNYSDVYSAFSTPFPDPGSIGSQSIIMFVPKNPAAASPKSQVMPMGTVGMAVNGIPIYSSLAANTDNIFAEAGSFDQCQGHPAGTMYHYHSEPYSISYDDNNLIGVMRDGFFIYGRKDYGGTYPGSISAIQTAGTSDNLYVYGGHVGSDPLTGTGSTFHYHLTEWKGCYHEVSNVKQSDDGSVNDTLNTPSQTCASGVPIDGWFMTGRGNGGVFSTLPGGLVGSQSPAQSVTAIRYYYGTPGTCTGCGN